MSTSRDIIESESGNVRYWTVDPVVTTGTTDRSGPWFPGASPHDPRIRRFAELLREYVPDDDRTPAEWQDVVAAIWRQVDEEVNSATRTPVDRRGVNQYAIDDDRRGYG